MVISEEPMDIKLEPENITKTLSPVKPPVEPSKWQTVKKTTSSSNQGWKFPVSVSRRPDTVSVSVSGIPDTDTGDGYWLFSIGIPDTGYGYWLFSIGIPDTGYGYQRNFFIILLFRL